jgi:hypothetical protein
MPATKDAAQERLFDYEGRTLGIVPSADDILHTPAWRGVFVATIDEVDYYMLEEADVRAVQRW